MNIKDYSQKTQDTIREIAAKRGVSEADVINRFYSLFRREKMFDTSGDIFARSQDGQFESFFLAK